MLSSARGDNNKHIFNVVLQEKQQQLHFDVAGSGHIARVAREQAT
jgi:hypothetical protein